jgi:hypothetical protein
VDGKVGQGLQLDGVKQHLAVPGVLKKTDRFTIMLWANICSYPDLASIFHNSGFEM